MKVTNVCIEENSNTGELLDATKNKMSVEKSIPLHSEIKLGKKYLKEDDQSNLPVSRQSKIVFTKHSHPDSFNKDCEIHLNNSDLFMNHKEIMADELENINKKLSDLNLASQKQEENFSDCIVEQLIPSDKNSPCVDRKNEFQVNNIEIKERGPVVKKNLTNRYSPLKSVNEKHGPCQSYDPKVVNKEHGPRQSYDPNEVISQISDTKANYNEGNISHLADQSLLHMCCSLVTEIKNPVKNDAVIVNFLSFHSENQPYSPSNLLSPESGYGTSPMPESPLTSPVNIYDVDKPYLENDINCTLDSTIINYSEGSVSTTFSEYNKKNANDLEFNTESFIKGINFENTNKDFKLLEAINSPDIEKNENVLNAKFNENFDIQNKEHINDIYHTVQKDDFTNESVKKDLTQKEIEDCFIDAEEFIMEDSKNTNPDTATIKNITKDKANEVQPNYQLFITPVIICKPSPANQNLNFAGSRVRKERPILPRPLNTSSRSPSEQICQPAVAREEHSEAKRELNNILVNQEKVSCSYKIYKRVNKDVQRSVIYIENEEKQSNLHLAIINHELEHAFSIVEIHKLYYREDSSAINLSDKTGKTALCYAVIHELSLMVAYLLESGAMPNIKDKNGFTSLDYALTAQLKSKDKSNFMLCQQMIEVLKRKGALHSEKFMHQQEYNCTQTEMLFKENEVLSNPNVVDATNLCKNFNTK